MRYTSVIEKDQKQERGRETHTATTRVVKPSGNCFTLFTLILSRPGNKLEKYCALLSAACLALGAARPAAQAGLSLCARHQKFTTS